MYVPNGIARALSTSTKRTIVSQPLKVISELLSADQGVKEISDDQHCDDETEEVGGGHIRSTPSIIHSNSRNATIPIAIARMSIAITLDDRPSQSHDDLVSTRNDFVTPREATRELN
jgi:hypothetical protein